MRTLHRERPSHIEMSVLELVGEGKSNKEIGQTLDRSPLTIKSHISRMGERYRITRRTALLSLAYLRRWLDGRGRDAT